MYPEGITVKFDDGVAVLAVQCSHRQQRNTTIKLNGDSLQIHQLQKLRKIGDIAIGQADIYVMFNLLVGPRQEGPS